MGSIVGTNLDQDRYERLAHSAKPLSETEAKALINDEFGFEFSRIKLISEVDKWELDESSKKWKHKETYNRPPLYDATDWNYIRFDVNGYQYEFINGELYFYED